MATDMLMSPVRPGEILLAEFLEPLGVSQYQLAKAMDLPTRGINGSAASAPTRRCGSPAILARRSDSG
jgi:hypothetical protein